MSVLSQNKRFDRQQIQKDEFGGIDVDANFQPTQFDANVKRQKGKTFTINERDDVIRVDDVFQDLGSSKANEDGDSQNSGITFGRRSEAEIQPLQPTRRTWWIFDADKRKEFLNSIEQNIRRGPLAAKRADLIFKMFYLLGFEDREIFWIVTNRRAGYFENIVEVKSLRQRLVKEGLQIFGERDVVTNLPNEVKPADLPFAAQSEIEPDNFGFATALRCVVEGCRSVFRGNGPAHPMARYICPCHPRRLFNRISLQIALEAHPNLAPDQVWAGPSKRYAFICPDHGVYERRFDDWKAICPQCSELSAPENTAQHTENVELSTNPKVEIMPDATMDVGKTETAAVTIETDLSNAGMPSGATAFSFLAQDPESTSNSAIGRI